MRQSQGTSSNTVKFKIAQQPSSLLATQDTITDPDCQTTQLSQGSEDSDQEYPIKCIVRESQTQYLIAWEGPYEPTWEPKHYANDAAIETWENRKKKNTTSRNCYHRDKESQSNPESFLDFTSQSTTTASLPSTIPETQPSQNSPDSSGWVASSALSQETALSGSLYCPTASNFASQSTSGFPAGTQSQHSEDSYIPSQSAWRLSGSTSTRAELLNGHLNRARRTSRIHSAYSSPSSSFSSSLSSSISITERSQPRSDTLLHQAVTASAAASQSSSSALPSSIPASRSARKRRPTIEIAETPPSQLRTDRYSGSPFNQSSTSTSNGDYSRSHGPSSCDSARITSLAAFQTPCRQPRLSDSLYIPETVPRGYSEQPSRNATFLSDPSRRYINHSAHSKSPSPHLSRLDDLEINPREQDITMDNSTSNSGASQPTFSLEEAMRNNPGKTFRERRAWIKEQERANIKPLQSMSSSVTPSSAGDIEPSPAVAVPETIDPLSVRVDRVPPTHAGHLEHAHAHAHESPVPFIAPQAIHLDQTAVADALLSQPEHIDATVLPELPRESITQETDLGLGIEDQPLETQLEGVFLGPSEFAIPLSMDTRVKDDYDSTLEREKKDIAKFLDEPLSSSVLMNGGEPEDDYLISKMRKMIGELDEVTTHPDLKLPDQPSPATPERAQETATWAEYSSTKFQLFGYFIDSIIDRDIHIVIMAKAGASVRIVENYLVGKGFENTQLIGTGASILQKRSVTFAVRATNDERVAPIHRQAALVIALDSSFRADSPAVQQIRASSQHGSDVYLVPVVRLIISNTAEHVGRCIPECSEANGLRLLIKYTLKVNSAAGELQDDALNVQEYAEEIALFLSTDPAARRWRLALMERIPMDEEDVPSLEVEQLRSMSSSRQKRWLEGEVNEDNNRSKRQRVTPFQDISHISDSMKGQSQDLEDRAQPCDNNLLEQNKALAREVKRLQAELSETRTRLQKTESNFAKLQHRYEARHNEYHKLRQNFDHSVAEVKKKDERLERQRTEIAKFKEERTTLLKDVEDARNAVKEGGGLPAELETAKEEIRKLSKENASLQRTVQQERSQTDYTRQQYQNASTSAAQSAMEVRQLEEQMTELKQKATGDALKMKELKVKNDADRHLARVEELEAALAARDDILTRKEDELRELKKNRPSTRATSLQPRSPKWGASRPTSPGANNANSARAGSTLRYRAEMS
ncbi:hypothetical protein AJ80_01116 [Polytolypa hystricis UAMH7299]|uniref:Chromo domain-containing protein n=1 Tax=Polytolypa hystricis (strain UAMH7299) TaxID=1447883 RepID=A0A2B7Z1P4_POLH7|nr:hypothetical protein AJ80_01116 [Polytolypa hystricis UAMH7299]